MAASITPPPLLFKHHSWSPDIHRDVEWQKLKIKQQRRFYHGCKSVDAVTDEDIKELRACFELGFGFDPCNELDPKVAGAFPALELYAAVTRQFNNRLILSRTSSSLSSETTSSSSLSSPTRSLSSLSSIIDPSDDPKKVKMRLKQWAQVVACSVREASPKLIGR